MTTVPKTTEPDAIRQALATIAFDLATKGGAGCLAYHLLMSHGVSHEEAVGLNHEINAAGHQHNFTRLTRAAEMAYEAAKAAQAKRDAEVKQLRAEMGILADDIADAAALDAENGAEDAAKAQYEIAGSLRALLAGGAA